MKQKLFKVLNFFFLLGGIFIVFLICYQMGWDKIALKITNIRFWQIGIILLLPVTWNFIHSMVWYNFLGDKKKLNRMELFKAHLASGAVAEIIPLGFAGGESYRAFYLKKKHETKSEGSSSNIYVSILVYNTVHFLATIVFMALSFSLITSTLNISLIEKILVFAVLLLFLAGLFIFIRKQKKDFMRGIFNYLEKFKMFRGFVKRKMLKAQKIDNLLNAFYTKQNKFFLSFFNFIVFFKIDWND